MNVRLILPALLLLAMPAVAQSSFESATPAGWGTSAPGFHAPLPETQAFQANIIADPVSAVVRLTPAPGYYLYRHTFDAKASGASLGKISSNPGEMHDDPHFGRVEVFYGPADITIPFTQAPKGPVELSVSFQGCQREGICYPPMERAFRIEGNTAVPVLTSEEPLPVTPTEPAAPTAQQAVPATAEGAVANQAEDQRLAAVLEDKPMWQAWGIFLGLGLLLGLTPCVLPMVPILMGLIAGAKVQSTRQAFGLSTVYVLTHATVFAGLGALAAWAGAGIQAAFQQAWVLIPMALLMGGLGLAMAMGAHIQMPLRLQHWAGQRGQGGQWVGVMVMGALSSLIVGPCVAPPLAGAVLFLAQSGNPLMGAGALFALGLGMGAPLLLAGAGMGRFLPRAGQWGTWLTKALGLGFVVLGAWLATRALPLVTVAAWTAALVGLAAAWLAGRSKAEPHQRSSAIGLGMAAVMALGLSWSQHAPVEPFPTSQTGLFTAVASSQELDQRLGQAKTEGKTVVLDFYADWCTACLDMEKGTFADGQVRQRLGQNDLVMLKVDVTQNTPEDRALMKRYGIVGPPATLFFQGENETRPLRLVGAEASVPFLKRVDTAVQCNAPTTQWAAKTAKTAVC